ncbi:MAG TPA: undecaprenyldiphospho-muramoylpentapeptide beta-N-acetylglucosaminyltransferase [Oscillatoriaceae cyanobacterium]
MADMLFTGGGTGGHLYPALAVAEAVRELEPSTEILFVGTPERIEARVVPEHGYRFAAIAAEGLSRRPVAAARALLKLVAAVAKARRLIRQEKPRVVLGTGGYVSAPVLLAAWLSGVPVVLQEQNVVPGKVNRWLARVAREVATAFPESARYFSGPVVALGNPIRTAAFDQSPEDARRALGYAPDAKVLLVTGGSQGAKRLNEALVGALPEILGKTDWQVLHVTGPAQLDAVRAQAPDSPRYRAIGYCETMPTAILASALVMSRAGATTLAELTATGRPMLLVPYPHAGGHQRLNARAIVEAGGGIEIEDAQLTPERLSAALLPIMTDEATRTRMTQASATLGRPEAARELAKRLIDLAHESSQSASSITSGPSSAGELAHGERVDG